MVQQEVKQEHLSTVGAKVDSLVHFMNLSAKTDIFVQKVFTVFTL